MQSQTNKSVFSGACVSYRKQNIAFQKTRTHLPANGGKKCWLKNGLKGLCLRTPSLPYRTSSPLPCLLANEPENDNKGGLPGSVAF